MSEVKMGSKVLYQGEVYYFRGYSDDGRALLAKNIDGKPTLSVKFDREFPLIVLGA